MPTQLGEINEAAESARDLTFLKQMDRHMQRHVGRAKCSRPPPGGLPPRARTRRDRDPVATGAPGSYGGRRVRCRARGGPGAAAHGSIFGNTPVVNVELGRLPAMRDEMPFGPFELVTGHHDVDVQRAATAGQRQPPAA
jgi:hypothetical protein